MPRLQVPVNNIQVMLELLPERGKENRKWGRLKGPDPHLQLPQVNKFRPVYRQTMTGPSLRMLQHRAHHPSERTTLLTTKANERDLFIVHVHFCVSMNLFNTIFQLYK